MVIQKNYSQFLRRPGITYGELFRNFGLRQMCKILVIQNHSIWNFKTIELLYIFVKNGEKILKLWKMSEN